MRSRIGARAVTLMSALSAVALFGGALIALPLPGALAETKPASSAAPQLAEAVADGHALFGTDSFGGSGTCETCHSDGGHGPGHLPDGKPIPSLEGAAAHYPRWSAKAGAVITLSGQIGRCVAGALKGTPPAPASKQAVDLETYVASLSAGQVMGSQFQSKPQAN